MALTRATQLIVSDDDPIDTITLSYEDRYKRRISMVSDGGLHFLLDLPKATELVSGNDLLLEDGRRVRVLSAKERLIKVSAKNAQHLSSTAWHIGNRHLACEINKNYLLIKFDHVILDMLKNLGNKVEIVEEPFNPQGGAYGKGRTHDHG